MTYCINSECSLKSSRTLFVFLKYTTGAVRLHSSHTMLVSAQIFFPGLRHSCCHCSNVSKQQVQCKSSFLTLSTRLPSSSWLPCIWNSESQLPKATFLLTSKELRRQVWTVDSSSDFKEVPISETLKKVSSHYWGKCIILPVLWKVSNYMLCFSV